MSIEICHNLGVEDDLQNCSGAMEPIRIMRIIARMNLGGPAIQITGLMRGLDFNDFEQRLYTGYCREDEIDYLETIATDIPFYKVSGMGRKLSILDDAKAMRFLINEIRAFQPHIIHTHTTKAGVLGRLAAILSGHKAFRIHTFHGHLLFGYFSSFKTFLVVLVERLLARQTNLLFTVGNKVKFDLLAKKIGKFNQYVEMPPGLVLNELPTREVAISKFHLSSNVVYCAWIGRLAKVKRPDRFLEVVQVLKSRSISLEFLIVGDGQMYEECQKMIKELNLPVKLLGWITAIEDILALVNFTVLTSDNEGMPLSLIQSGMAGLPTVTVDIGSAAEIVLDGVTGLVTSNKPEEIADAIQKLYLNDSLQATMGVAARKHTLSKFSLTRLIRDHEDIYRRALT